MRFIYANALCNIAASASTDPDGGLFRVRDGGSLRPGFVRATFGAHDAISYYVFDKDYADNQVFAGPLQRRGWVFQERILAPRTIHFTQNQVFWECFAELKCEAFPCGFPESFPLKTSLESSLKPGKSQPGFASLHIFNAWNNLVAEYTKCQLTRESDRLVAFAGIARLFQESTGDEYIAGLWKSRLIAQLHWHVETPASAYKPEYCAPSWSWASTSSPVVPHGLSVETQFHIKALDAAVQASQADALGAVASGSLTLEGLLVSATCTRPEIREGYVLEIGPHKVLGRVYFDVMTDPEETRAIKCLLLRTEPTEFTIIKGNEETFTSVVLYFLILELVCADANTYRRSGCFEVDERQWNEEIGIAVSETGLVIPAEHLQPSIVTLV